LEQNISLSDSYARKLRAVNEILKNYTRFRFVRTSFYQIYQRREDIKSMLNKYIDYYDFWSQNNQYIKLLYFACGDIFYASSVSIEKLKRNYHISSTYIVK